MLKIIIFALLSSITCQDVSSFSQNSVKTNKLMKNYNLDRIICPDKETYCGDRQTCCQLESGIYGCCPEPNAVCCSDHLSCCPHGTTCNLSNGTCDYLNQQTYIPMKRKLPSLKSKSVECPDGQSQCDDGQTCCLLASGSWGCCPYPNAVCCSDQIHCCPHGTTCDVAEGKCNFGKNQILPIFKIQLPTIRNNYVLCPDGQSQCDDGQTCCLLASGRWGCCPYVSAACCSDQIHCCPHNSKCNIDKGTCETSTYETIIFMKPNVKAVLKSKLITCPDGESECEDDQTCCLMDDGTYGCCPFKNAVCCYDHVHCCPENTTCNVSEGLCEKQKYGLKK